MNMYESNLLDLPLLPLRDVVVFPHMVIPLFVGREKSIQALETAMNGDKQIFLAAQRDAGDDDPGRDGLYDIGTVAQILQLLKLPDGTVKVLVEGQYRGKLDTLADTGSYWLATITQVQHKTLQDNEGEVLARSLLNEFEQYVKLTKKAAPEVLNSVNSIREPERLADTIAAHLALKLEEKQEILDITDIHATCGTPDVDHGVGNRHPEGGKADSRPRQKADGKEPARVLPERADQGHPERAGRAGGGRRRSGK
jgi:ATP-dependent Lon protease